MFQSLAVVLKKNPIYESDNLVNVFSQNFGKIEVIARGSQKIISKLSAHLEPINLISLEFIFGKNFKIATSAQIINGFQKIKNDFYKTKLVLEIFDYIDKNISFEEQDLNFWQFLINFLDKIEKENEFNIEKSKISRIYFLINFLKFLGFLPNLNQCSKCDNTNFKKAYLMPKQGLLCNNCFKQNNLIRQENSLEIEELNFLKTLLIFQISFAAEIWKMEKNQLISQNFNKIQNMLKIFLRESAI